MANRRTQQFTFSTERETTNLFAQVTFGSSGAPTLNTGGAYITSVTRNSTGDFTFTFKDVWNKLMACEIAYQSGANSPAAALNYIKANAVSSATSKTLEIVFTNTSGTATDPASGEIIYFDFTFKNSSVTY